MIRACSRSGKAEIEPLESRRLLSAVYGFHEVADTSTLAPGQAWTMSNLYSPSISSDGHVAFYASDSGNNSGIFTDRNGTLQAVAATGTDPAGVGVPIDGVGTSPIISGQNILFIAYGPDPAGGTNDELWAIKDINGPQSVIYGSDQPIPNYSGNAKTVQSIYPSQLLASTAVLNLQWYSNSGDSIDAYYSDGGATSTSPLSEILQGPLTNPDGTSDRLIQVDESGSYDGTNLTFIASDLHTNADSSVTDTLGFYSTGGGLHKVVALNSASLGSGGPFNSLEGDFGTDDGSIGFSMSSAAGFSAVFIVSPTGQVTRVVDSTTAVPGGGTFSGLESDGVGLSNGNVLFSALNGNQGHGLYRSFNGAISKVIAPNDTLDGKTVSDVTFSPKGISGDNVAMLIGFTDGSYAIYEAPVVRGSDQIVPVEPTASTASTSSFGSTPTNSWVDAPLAQTLTFSAAAGSAFTGITKLPTGYSTAFQITAGGSFLGTFAAGASVPFAGTSTTRFTVTGINSAVKPTGALGFPIDLNYSTPTAAIAATVGIADSGSISGTVFNDANGNNVEDSTETGFAGRTVYLDSNNNSVLDNGEVTTTTSLIGTYSFVGLAAGTYKVRALPVSGFVQTTPATNFGQTVSLAAGQAVTGKNFGIKAIAIASIAGTIYSDTNSNGKKDSGEVGIANVTVYLDANNNLALDSNEVKTTTSSTGTYLFSNLPAGVYKVRQIRPGNATQTVPTNNFGIGVTLGTGQAIAGQDIGDHVTAPAGGSITGTVFNDANSDGTQQSLEAGLLGWSVYLDINNDGTRDDNEPAVITTSNGSYSFTGLSAGNYIIRVIPLGGWSQTYPANNLGEHITLATSQNMTGIKFGEKVI